LMHVRLLAVRNCFDAFWPLLLGIVVITGHAFSEDAPHRTGNSSSGPQYLDRGELKLPADFEKWVFVGSNLGIEYRSDTTQPPKEEAAKTEQKTGNFHNVYIDPAAYAHYVKTG